MSKGTVIHPWEHNAALKRITELESETAAFQRFVGYLLPRIRAQVEVINKHIPNGPIIAASILDDIEDAHSVAKATS